MQFLKLLMVPEKNNFGYVWIYFKACQ